MPHCIGRFGKVLLGAGVTLLLGAAPHSPRVSDEVILHTVVAGESISLICIDYYGYYSDALGKAIAMLNPSLKNVDLIYAGQKLSFRKPREGTAAPQIGMLPRPDSAAAVSAVETEPAPSAAGAQLFEKKLSVTQGVVTCVEGAVLWQRGASAARLPLKINTVVSPGNLIETGTNGRVELIINRESVVRIRENSRVVLEGFRSSSGGTSDRTRVGCGVGTIWTKVKKFRDRISRFELELPTAIAGVHGTVYETVVASDSASEVKVFSGEVAVRSADSPVPAPQETNGVTEVAGPREVAPPQEVTMEHWTQIVRSMQRLSIDKKGVPGAPVAFPEDGDSDWETWNRERDKRISALFGEQGR